MPALELSGQRVVVMGLGRHGGGVGVTRYLAQSGARVTVTDQDTPQSLATSLESLVDVPIERFSLGGHQPADFENADLVVVNPAVRPDSSWLRQVRSRGIPITTEIELFLGLCPARIIAVTGTNGKSTTASMIHHLLRSAGRRSWLGGNLGGSLLNELAHITAADWVVLELSSFQLARIETLDRAIEVAVLLNCTPNHLDWHSDFESYACAKRHLLELQDESGLALFGTRQAPLDEWRRRVRGQQIEPVERRLLPRLATAGVHQQQNAACAAAVALAVGCSSADLQRLASFTGLPHRLEFIGTYAGRRFYDDSKATTPEATRAALQAIPGPIRLLVGGHAKQVSFENFGREIAELVASAACFGSAGPEIYRSFPATADNSLHAKLKEALASAFAASRPGDAILLSPGCASTDQYRDFAERAAEFRQLAASFAQESSPPTAPPCAKK